jgi:hypothetical protein
MSGPRVFGLPHLSEDAVAAFADGVLSAAAAGRAQRHCAECAECADAVRGQRETAMMLRAAQAPSLPSGLLDRLTGVPMSAPLPPPRGGLPTVLGADGTAMFVAHDVRKAGSGERSGGPARPDDAQPPQVQPPQVQPPQVQPPQVQPSQGHPRQGHRRGALPVTVLASAAAVVAAGTFGGHVSTLAADRQAPSGAANVAGALSGGQVPGARSASPLGGTASLLSVSRSAGLGTNKVLDQAARPVRAPGAVVSVLLAPLDSAADRSGTAAQRPGAAVQQPAVQQPGAAAVSTQSPARHGMWSFPALAAMMARPPTATP